MLISTYIESRNAFQEVQKRLVSRFSSIELDPFSSGCPGAGKDAVPETVHHVLVRVDPREDGRWKKQDTRIKTVRDLHCLSCFVRKLELSFAVAVMVTVCLPAFLSVRPSVRPFVCLSV